MITARLINQDARLNDFQQIGGISYVNGDMITVVIQLFNEELNTRHIPSALTTVSLGVNFSDGSIQDATTNSNNLNMSVLDTDDRSIWMVDIPTSNVGSILTTPLTGKVLVGGNITFRTVGDLNRPRGTAVTETKGIIFNALQRVIVS